eukprot:2757821-Rhodomonas_salina.2
MSGTDLAYAATRRRGRGGAGARGRALGPIILRACYALSGTDLGYAATRSGVSISAMVVFPYGPMRCPLLRKDMLLPSPMYWDG